MTNLVTAAQMRAIEHAAIESGEVTGLELMERAGAGVVEAILTEWPGMAKTPQKAVILCGPGNNGGNGFVVARLLKARGWAVEVFLYGEVEALPPDAKANAERWLEEGAIAAACQNPKDNGPFLWPSCYDIIVDAVFGAGLKQKVNDPCLWEWFWLIDDAIDVYELEKLRDSAPGGVVWQAPRSVAVDIPSGLCADTGSVLGGKPAHGLRAPRVMLSVALQAVKPGQLRAAGPEYCGKLVVCDIGLEKWAGLAEGRK